MNKFILLGLCSALVFVTAAAPAATVIATNTAIGALNQSYDGSDLVISNCTVTVDGPHSFNSLLVGAGGVLTHSYFSSGNPFISNSVFDEPQTLNGTLPATLLNTNVQGSVTVVDTNGVTIYSNGVDYIQTNLSNGTTQIYATTNSAIPSNATVLVSYLWNYNYSPGLNISVTNDVTIAPGGAINVNGIGYGAGFGPGAGTSGSGNPLPGNGAGHGGSGGYSLGSGGLAGICYDSLYQPVNLGSGGGSSYAGSGGNGGGLVQITAGGNANIYGIINANGNSATNARSGGGAGGGIWITATNITGSGSLTANGGSGELPYGGGGGGGRISFQCISNLFSGTLFAQGANGYQAGGAGTVFTHSAGTNGLLIVDNGGHTNAFSSVNLNSLTDVIIRNGAGVQPSGLFLPHNLTVGANSLLEGNSQVNFILTVTGNLWIQSGGVLTVDSQGSQPGTGSNPGLIYNTGPPYPCGGGGHGGYGATGSNPNAIGGVSSFDSQTGPTAFGSGGGGPLFGGTTALGGYGGGVLLLNVTGTLQLDGRISANGGNASGTGGGGGGAGGSIYIENCALLAGAGTIAANGGTGVTAYGGGGGGGGRVAVYATSNTFTGMLTAFGGAGVNYGGAGTVYTQLGNSPAQLILDNGGNAGTNTSITYATANLSIQNGARATASGSVSFNNLFVSSNAWLSHAAGSSLTIIISSNAIIQAGGGFTGDFLGHTGGTGSAAGSGNSSSPYYPCSGGGYGGSGGFSVSNTVAPASFVGDNPTSPSSSYSGSGGGSSSGVSIGGTGGGFLQMTVNGTLQLDGLLSANGGPGSGPGGGGAAGGAVYLHIGSWTGAGAIMVNGGAGATYGGGGGGGRIAVYFNTNKFTGTLSAFGGAGANYGGSGSIYTKTNSAPNGQVIADNAGHPGAATFWSSSSSTDLTLRNGAGCFLSGSSSFGNVVVASNSCLAVTNTLNTPITVTAASLTVQPGGLVSADLAGNFLGSGSGLGGSYIGTPYYQAGGGGHGGTGGFALSNAAAGGTYFDTESSPGQTGGAGGGYQTYSLGGRGGGALILTLTGPLQLDGLLSANGGNGSGDGGGGGAGGTLNISCTGLRGAGAISANGGNGVSNIGGGGGGGMIYAAFTSNTFSGPITAYGGSGANYGGAGSIYFRTNQTGQTLLIADNGGHRGTNTPLASANNWIIRNGAVAFAQNTSQSLNSLLVGSNGWLLSSAIVSGASLNLFVSGNATIQAGGGILGDGYGSLQNVGTGRGFAYAISPYYQCSGAGHGGNGASGPFNVAGGASGGTTYDSSSAPTTSGSGGGGYSTYSLGGNGGGLIRLTVNGTLLLNGTISVNGLNGTGIGGGGGSGGGVYLAGVGFGPANTITGTGSITANGGSGAGTYGGGGGGGRISITSFYNNTFTGSISAVGGSGLAYGGAGSIYTKTSQQSYGQLLLDNGGNSGTNTTFDATAVDATIQNNAIGSLPTTRFWSTHNILLHTNGTLTAPASSSLNTLVANNLTIDPGGRITLDGIGNTSQTGNGSGSSAVTGSFGGGASHGGYGGGNRSGYGLAYDSILAPVMSGSGGGNYSPYSGGFGGGALQLTVNGTLTVNGRISANGTGGGYGTGGGSGGSLYFPYVNTFAGNGLISANGGSTNSASLGGGGGGGRIAMYITNSTFSGLLSAHGGYGSVPGGAGTIFTTIAGYQSLTIDNAGLVGTNTPISSGLPNVFDLNISNAAVATTASPLPVLNNLNLGTGSTLTTPHTQSNLFLAVKNNFNLAGNLVADNLGYPQTNGPGAGGSLSQEGAGGGYGGLGGNSASGASGGTNYGSASQPVDFGSGGGNGAQGGSTGSEGGGAIRLDVGGIFNLTGTLSANGDFAQQDNAGGGAGGSIWISANTLSGAGNISAAGGNGDLYYGGGGGGGRIAIYSPANQFLGATNVSGGLGDNNGQLGTIFLSSSFLDFLVQSQSPTGTVNNTVSSADIYFNDAVDPASVSAAAFTVTTPAGAIAPSNITASATGATSVHLTFPLQNLLGNYTIQVAPVLTNVLGYPLASGFSGSFTISLPVISGTVTDTNSAPVSGVLIQPDGGLIGATTDNNGNYSIGVPPGWNGTLTPSYGTAMFVPGSLVFTNITTSVTNQNFLIVPTIAPALAASLSSTNLSFTWSGLTGVTYQIWSSPDLITWTPYGDPIPGLTGSMQVALPIDPANPGLFYRLGASD